MSALLAPLLQNHLIVSSTLKDSYNKKGLLNINFASSLTFAFLFFFPFVAYACHHDITFCLSTFIYIAQRLGPANVYNIFISRDELLVCRTKGALCTVVLK